jgi:hypothetical protein
MQKLECPRMTTETNIELNEQEQVLLEQYQKAPRLPNKKHVFVLVKQHGDLIAALAEDGELTLGADIEVKDAATEFWNYVKLYRPSEQQSNDEITKLKAHCYDLIQENKALKAQALFVASMK